MGIYDAKENASRVRHGILSLLSGRAIDFISASAPLVVVFDGDPSQFSGGRILLFQQFFLDRLGIIPEIVRQVPACIRVYFSIERDDRDAVKAALCTADGKATPDFQVLCRELNVSLVQLGGTIIRLK